MGSYGDEASPGIYFTIWNVYTLYVVTGVRFLTGTISLRNMNILTTLTRDIQCESLLRMRQSVVTCTMYPDTDL